MKTHYSTYVPKETAEKLEAVVGARRLKGRTSAAVIVLERFAGDLAATAVRGFAAVEPYLEEEWDHRLALELDQKLYDEIVLASASAGIYRQRLAGVILVAHQDRFDELIAGNGEQL